MRGALGVIEVIGLGTAITALDAACKAADVTLVGYDKVIGVNKAISVVVNISGEVAAVKAAVEAGAAAATKVGTLVSSNVLPRPHDELDMLLNEFSKNLKKKVTSEEKVEEVVVEEEKTIENPPSKDGKEDAKSKKSKGNQ